MRTFGRRLRVVTPAALAAARVDLTATGALHALVVFEPVGRPLPHVADHVVEPVVVGRKRTDGRAARKPVRQRVLDRELALPRVGHVVAFGRELRAPRVLGRLEPAARRKLPLRLRRKRLADPVRVGLDVLVRDLHDGVALAPLDRRVGTLGVAPVCAGDVRPPVVVIAQIDAFRRLAKHDRRRDQQRRIGAGVCGRVGDALAQRDVSGRVDEARELGVRHEPAVDPEAVDGDGVRRPFFRVVLVGTHAERAARDPGHLGVLGLGRRGFARSSLHRGPV